MHQASQIKVLFIGHLQNNPGLVEHFKLIRATVWETGDHHDAYIRHQDGEYYEEFKDILSETRTEAHNLDNILEA